MDNRLRIASCLLTVLLLAVTAVGMSFADEVGPGAHAAGNSSNAPAETGGSQPSSIEQAGESGGTKLDGLSEAHGKGDDKRDDARALGSSEGPRKGLGAAPGGTGASGSGDNGDHAIDTLIGMPSRRFDRSRSGVGNVKARVRLLAPRRPSMLGKSDQGVRNAIGMPVAPHSGHERRESEHRSVPIVVPNIPAANAAASTNAQAHPTFMRADTSPGLSSSASNRGVITGTGATHPGAGQQSIGGRAKTVVGISGSTVRSKH